MKYRLKFQHTFEKEAKRLGKRYMSMKSDIASLSEELLANPHLGTDLGGGLRKIRRSGGGGGDRNQLALHLRQGGAFFYQQERNRRTASAERTEMT